MNILQSLREAGYTAEQALNVLNRTYPGMSSAIRQASQAGHSADQILSTFGSVGFQALNAFKGKKGEKSEDPYPEDANPYIEARKERGRQKELPQGLKTAGKFAATAAGALAMPYLMKAASPILQRAAPAVMDYMMGGRREQEEGQPEAEQALEMEEPTQPEQATESPSYKAGEILDQMGVADQVRGMAGKVKPEDIASVVEQHLLKPGQRKWLKENVKEPLPNLINRFLTEEQESQATQDPGTQAEPELEAQQQVQQGQLSQPEAQTAQTQLPPTPISEDDNKRLKEKQAEIEPGDEKELVLVNGKIGQVESVKDGIAKVSVDGKIHHKKLDDLEKSPMPARDLATVYQELLDTMPEEDKSRVMNWAGYDEDVNELFVRYHNGDGYTIKNIPETFVDQLKNVMFKAKTSGSNHIGAWRKGEKSRYAGVSAVLEAMKKELGKGNEYSRKYKTVYDFLEAPEKALSERNKEKSAAKQAEKKREVEAKKAEKKREADEKKAEKARQKRKKPE
jgi:hypothetical protein